MHNELGTDSDHRAGSEMACGSKESERPLSRFPLRGKAGAGGFPHAGARSAASKKRWHASCAGSPHKRAAAPLWVPCERGTQGLATCETTAGLVTITIGRHRPMSAEAFTQNT
jgi:hypothetical protein